MEYFGDHFWSTLSTFLLTVVLLWVAYIAVAAAEMFIITPMKIKRIMNRQGVQGPSGHLLLGNRMDAYRLQQVEAEKDLKTGDYNILSHVMPYHVRNCQSYGGFSFSCKFQFPKLYWAFINCPKLCHHFVSLTNKSVSANLLVVETLRQFISNFFPLD
jgi:hypothetical protein